MRFIQDNTVFLLECQRNKKPSPGKYYKGWQSATNNPIKKARILTNSPLFGISCKLSNCIGIDIDLWKAYLIEAHQFSTEKDAINKEIKKKGSIYFIYHNESATFYIAFKAQTNYIRVRKITDPQYIAYLNELRAKHPQHLKNTTQKYQDTRHLITREQRGTAELIAEHYNTKRDEHNGFLQLIAFCDRFNLDDPSESGGVWMNTWKTLTPSGGSHYLLRNTIDINQNACHHLGYPNIDLRWKGHLCGGERGGYEVVNDVMPIAAPTELLEVLRTARAPTERNSGRSNKEMAQTLNARKNDGAVTANGTRAFNHAYIQRVIDGSVRQMLSATDNRNDTLNRLCYSLGRFLSQDISTPDHSKQQLYQLFVTRMQSAALDAGLSEDETAKTIHSGLRAGEAKAIEPVQQQHFKE